MTTSVKTCNRCFIEKPISEFNKSVGMKDGHFNQCKSCRSILVHNYQKTHKTHLQKKANEWAKKNRRKRYETELRYRAKYPEKRTAHIKVSNAIQSKKLKKKPCELCGGTKNIQAHHPDYNRPLTVQWVCRKHHNQLHNTD